MPSLTSNLNLNTWLENEPVDFREVNANFEKIDKLVNCTESGIVTSSYTGGSDSVVTWHYKKFSDKTVEFSAKLAFTNLKCNGGTEPPYYSGTSKIYFPFEMSEVYDVQSHLASNSFGWTSDITNRSVTDCVYLRLLCVFKETDELFKQIFVSVKGVLA